MTSRERFLIVLSGGTPDRMPLFETHFCLRFIREVLGGADAAQWHNVDDEVNMSQAMGLDMVWSTPVGSTSLSTAHPELSPGATTARRPRVRR